MTLTLSITTRNACRTLSIVPRWSFGYWDEGGVRTIDFGFVCYEAEILDEDFHKLMSDHLSDT